MRAAWSGSAGGWGFVAWVCRALGEGRGDGRVQPRSRTIGAAGDPEGIAGPGSSDDEAALMLLCGTSWGGARGCGRRARGRGLWSAPSGRTTRTPKRSRPCRGGAAGTVGGGGGGERGEEARSWARLTRTRLRLSPGEADWGGARPDSSRLRTYVVAEPSRRGSRRARNALAVNRLAQRAEASRAHRNRRVGEPSTSKAS